MLPPATMASRMQASTNGSVGTPCSASSRHHVCGATVTLLRATSAGATLGCDVHVPLWPSTSQLLHEERAAEHGPIVVGEDVRDENTGGAH